MRIILFIFFYLFTEKLEEIKVVHALILVITNH